MERSFGIISSMSTKETIRGLFKPETRGQFYASAAAGVTLLASFGFISVSIVPAVTGVVIAALALAYAFINSDSAKNKVVYTFCAALGGLLITLGYLTDHQQEAILAVVAPVLGISYAAAQTPTRNDEAVVVHNERLDGWTPAE